MPSFDIYVVLSTIVVMVVLLYSEKFRPSLLFSVVLIIYLFSNILTPEDVLQGLSNKQIVVIFLLMILSSGMRKVIGNNFFDWIFKNGISPKRFLMRMMLIVSSSSAFLNNTPIVAFMIPYVKDWSEQNKHAPSKFLIPLSFATILGGMITVVGTSTNLVLNGLIQQKGLTILNFKDFLFLGLIVTLLGWVYLYFFGYNLLPSHLDKAIINDSNLQEYIVETKIDKGSKLEGKNVKEAGLRNLKEIFLVEIFRDAKIITPVKPEEKLCEGDVLFFAGNKKSILEFISNFNGIHLPDQKAIEQYKHFNFTEAIIPSSSTLVGMKVKSSDFRKRFNASIIALHRHGKKVTSKIGETVLSSGDLLLLLSGDEINFSNDELLIVSNKSQKIVKEKRSLEKIVIAIFSFLFLIMGITGIFDLFLAVIVSILCLMFIKKIDIHDVKNSIDIDLVVMLVSALAIGTALTKTGSADWLVQSLLNISGSISILSMICILFVSTLILTSLITNAAAVSIMFPIALSLSEQTLGNYVPFFVAIAFAASGDFITPIGYQTNLMVMGPGRYSFKDFFKVGLPFTIIYIIACITFIYFYYLI